MRRFSDNQRILHNTGMLYLRMLLALLVGLYTSRIVLDVLGVNDFGTYHVVVGFVALLGFMQGAVTSAAQRYFAFDLGQSNGSNLRGLFNTSLRVHFLLAVCVVLLAETAGYWFVTSQLSIPSDRLQAALVAYHLAVASFVVGIMTVPLTAMLMAHERMGLFALMSMVDVLLKLAAVLLLPWLAWDKLSAYAALLLSVSLLTFSGFLLINRRVFPVIRLQWGSDGAGFRDMFGFIAWNTWGNLAYAMSEHGNNILLNIFFGPAFNAGRSVASQANGALNQLTTNVQAALNPQIVKLYASGEHQHMHTLVQRASKYNFLLLLVLAMPALFYTQQLLQIWLVTPPESAAVFLQLTLVVSLIDSISRPLMTAAQATGKIRLYQTVVGGILLLNLPAAYIMIKIWHRPELVIVSGILTALAALAARLLILKRLTGLAVRNYLITVLVRGAVAGGMAMALNSLMVLHDASGLNLLLGLIVNSMVTLLVVYFVGLNASEKRYVLCVLANVYKKFAK